MLQTLLLQWLFGKIAEIINRQQEGSTAMTLNAQHLLFRLVHKILNNLTYKIVFEDDMLLAISGVMREEYSSRTSSTTLA